VNDLTVIVPSRGRPEQATALARAFESTCTGDTRLVFAVDTDDPRQAEYSPLIRNGRVDVAINTSTTMVEALNRTALALLGDPEQMSIAVGFMGDDHCPRTLGWDMRYLEALTAMGTGMVYGDDLLQGGRLPTQVAMTSDIVRTLGYMVPPVLRHMYADNFWLTLGRSAGCIRYLPEVVIEHRHPLANKAEWDEGYLRVNDKAVYAQDEQAFSDYLRTSMPAAVEKVKALRD
jgi:hypothetical protein